MLEVGSLATGQPLRYRLGKQVADVILTAIRLHEFVPGARLPSETELCTQLGVNRMAVREGLRWLEDHKYIRMQRGRYGGAFVLDPEIDVVMDRLAGRAADLRQLFEYRTAIEPLVAALAAERISQDELSRLGVLHGEELQEPTVERDRFRAIDVAFHQIIAEASRNTYLIDAVQDIRVKLAPGLDLLAPSNDRRTQSVRCHGELIDCLNAHDASGASAVMRVHIDATARAVVAALAAQGVEEVRVDPR